MSYLGFPPKVRFTPVPDPMFGPLLEQIEDVAELKCTLRIIKLLHGKTGFPRYVSKADLFSDPILARGLANDTSGSQAAITRGLKLAIDRGTVLQAVLGTNGSESSVFVLNTETGRKTVSTIDGSTFSSFDQIEPFEGPFDRPNIFSLYEANIGMLNPMITEELKDAEKQYPSEWIEEAFREAVKSNKRSWRYVAAILERWEREGKDDGRSGRDSKTTGYKEFFRR